jgi:hypothetical protein
MSFMLTKEQVRNRTKTVTRRLGWAFLKPGDIVNAVEQGMGLKKGEKVKKICQLRIKSTRLEPLYQITKEECVKEGFPNMFPQDFIFTFRRLNKVRATQSVNRIKFGYV